MPPSVEEDLVAIGRIDAVPIILRTMRELTGLRFTLVARVLPDRWVACAVHDDVGFGLATGGELDVATTLCAEVRDSHQPILIEHASQDPRYRDHRTPKLYGFESYVAVPIFRATGEYFGNVCGLDPEPRNLSDAKTLSTLRLFSQLISLQLAADERHEADRKLLEAERQAATLREQFIAVLGHDLRNPLSSIVNGARILLAKSSADGERRTLDRIHGSAKRIAALVDDLMDLARGRLAGGLTPQLVAAPALGERLEHVVAEMRSGHPERVIELVSRIDAPVRGDQGRLEQLLSNLLANALEHGAPSTPIRVGLTADQERFVLEVENQGATIPESLRSRLFQPYFRGEGGSQRGLGLGLYIVSEIVKSHGGTIEVVSDDGRTTFRVAIPSE